MKNIIFGLVILIVGIGLIISANIFRDTNPGQVFQVTPVPILSPTPSEEQNRGSSISQPRPEGSGEIGTSCQVSGEIVFLNKNIYENKEAKIVYQNVDDSIRQIYWKSNPDDGALAIGPNLFEDLPLPNGERSVGLAFSKEPTDKNYTLTASITYGVKSMSGIVEERIADCTGKVGVDLSNI